MNNIRIFLDPDEREQHLKLQLDIVGIDVREFEDAAYCPISLTNTPAQLKPLIRERQRVLMEDVLRLACIEAYDPGSARFSPDTNLSDDHTRVYGVDFAKVAGAKFLVGHNLLPSTGVGIELQIAQQLMKVPVVFHDAGIRTSRMLPPRTIYLQYNDFAQEAGSFVKLFEELKNYDVGVGFNGSKPALLGFPRDSSKIVDLEELAAEILPNNQWVFDGKKPIPEFHVANPEIFVELKK